MAGKQLLRTVGLVGLALIGLGLWAAGPVFQEARLATAFAARQTCACVHIGGRPLDACLADLPGAADDVTVTQQDNALRVGVMGGVISARAVYREGYGCLLD